MNVPEAYGGAGMGALATAVVIEEVARHDGSLALTVASHNALGTGHLSRFGSEELRHRWLPELASGRALAAWALTEPGLGSDAAGMRTTAARRGGSWVLNGSKAFITQGTVAEVYVVFALEQPGAQAEGHHRLPRPEGDPRFHPAGTAWQAGNAQLRHGLAPF